MNSINCAIIRTLLCALLAATCLGASSLPPRDEEKPLKPPSRIAAGTSLSTMGVGGNLVFQFTPRMAFRAGYETLSFDYPFSFEENDISYQAELDYKTGVISLLADYYLTRSLYLTAGCGYNRFRPAVTGVASDAWQYGDISIPPDQIGEFLFSVKPSRTLSPYLGAGVGRNAGLKKNLAFTFEIGAYYQGAPDIAIEATGLLAPTADESHKQKELLERQFSAYTFYPFVKLGLSLVLFKL